MLLNMLTSLQNFWLRGFWENIFFFFSCRLYFCTLHSDETKNLEDRDILKKNVCIKKTIVWSCSKFLGMSFVSGHFFMWRHGHIICHIVYFLSKRANMTHGHHNSKLGYMYFMYYFSFCVSFIFLKYKIFEIELLILNNPLF